MKQAEPITTNFTHVVSWLIAEGGTDVNAGHPKFDVVFPIDHRVLYAFYQRNATFPKGEATTVTALLKHPIDKPSMDTILLLPLPIGMRRAPSARKGGDVGDRTLQTRSVEVSGVFVRCIPVWCVRRM
jgi:hypothetical protein